MSARGEITEIEEGSKFFKIKYNYENKTTYELQNRGSKPITATWTFFDVENLAIESERAKIDDTKVTLKVKPGETTHFVDLITKNTEEGWHYNYDSHMEVEDVPSWL
eukprot:TRINITY_DN8897_c0_g1_i2.p1 TRINITY_DN8897_c0_g1~~TRINITY_DN8897_c0_g1_i2.p1  ORF type:complete len:123 (+),score=23.87 TRINITY_DN8897_c0_g1_i2:50-370(+)